MRTLGFLLLSLLLAPAFAADQAGAEAVKKPVSASIRVPEESSGNGDPVGNVQVTYQDGTTDLWTTKNNCGQARVSPAGTVGWVIYEPATQVAASYKLRPCRQIVLCQKGKIVARISSPQPFIEEWQFQQDGAQVAVAAMFAHGKTFYTLYEAATGQSLATATSTDALIPSWAKPLHHEN